MGCLGIEWMPPSGGTLRDAQGAVCHAAALALRSIVPAAVSIQQAETEQHFTPAQAVAGVHLQQPNRSASSRGFPNDATFLTVPAASVAWSVAGGPLTGISVSGLATVGIVYQTTVATAQGIYAGNTGTLGLTVVNVNDDNYREYAGDGIGDKWQVDYFGQPPNANAGPAIDITGTGKNNLFKYIAGLNPIDRSASNAVFTLAIQPVPGQPARKNLTFSPAWADRNYTAKSKPDLNAATWGSISASGLTISSGTVGTITDLSATGAQKFYRIEITKP